MDTRNATASDDNPAIAREVPGKTIVFTGAMIPYAFGSSDGLFNLGRALSFVQVLPQGVYLAMNGKCFPGIASEKTATAANSKKCPQVDGLRRFCRRSKPFSRLGQS